MKLFCTNEGIGQYLFINYENWIIFKAMVAIQAYAGHFDCNEGKAVRGKIQYESGVLTTQQGSVSLLKLTRQYMKEIYYNFIITNGKHVVYFFCIK